MTPLCYVLRITKTLHLRDIVKIDLTAEGTKIYYEQHIKYSKYHNQESFLSKITKTSHTAFKVYDSNVACIGVANT